MNKKRILFVCIHNSARSQMAEGFINEFYGDSFEAESAGIEPGNLNLVVVKAMSEIGIDISGNSTNSCQQFIDEGRQYDFIVTVCDEASAERCPIFPGSGERIHMGFPDPSSFEGTEDERLIKTRQVRDEIKSKIEEWVQSILNKC